MDYIDRWVSETIREPTLMTAGQVLIAVSPYYDTGFPLTQAKLGRDFNKKPYITRIKSSLYNSYWIRPTDTPLDNTLPRVMTTKQFDESPYSTHVRTISGTPVKLEGYAGIYIYQNTAGNYAYCRVKTIGV